MRRLSRIAADAGIFLVLVAVAVVVLATAIIGHLGNLREKAAR